MLFSCRPLRGLVTFFNDPILGLRSQSLAPPQALCWRSLRELYADGCFAGYDFCAKANHAFCGDEAEGFK